jgi:serine/threonine protein kinase
MPFGPFFGHTASWRSCWIDTFSKETHVTHLKSRADPAAPVNLKVLNAEADGYCYVKHARAAGAFGRFFIGYSKQTARPVGIKEIMLPRPARLPAKPAGAAARNTETLEQVRHEVEMMLVAGSAYRPICAGVNPRGTKAYIVQELLFGDGADLQRELLLQRPRVGRNVFGRYMLGEMARGLKVLHEKGMIHRDIKPTNVLFDRASGNIAYADFGLAVVARCASGAAGTPAFMAFEQHDPQTRSQAATAKADVQSVALAVVYSLTGEAVLRVQRQGRRYRVASADLETFRAFWREWRYAEEPASDLVDSVAFAHFESILHELRGIDEELAGLLMLMLDPDPASRPTAAYVARHPGVELCERMNRTISEALERLPQFKEDYDYYLDMAAKAVQGLIDRGVLDRVSAGLAQTPPLRSADRGSRG